MSEARRVVRRARRHHSRGRVVSPALQKRAKYVLRREGQIRRAMEQRAQEGVVPSLRARVEELEAQLRELQASAWPAEEEVVEEEEEEEEEVSITVTSLPLTDFLFRGKKEKKKKKSGGGL